MTCLLFVRLQQQRPGDLPMFESDALLFDLGRLFNFGNFYARLGPSFHGGGVC
jgi:hypothetical protein